MSRVTRSTVVLLAALAPVAVAARAEGPQAYVADTVVDVGVISRGDKVVHDFVIQNAGDAELEITEVKPSCGCTVVSFSRLIQPGGVGMVTTELDTDDFRGPIAKSVTVFTNDPGNPRILLVLKANIRPQVEVEPSYVRWVVVEGSDYEPSEHRLRAPGGEEFRIEKVDSPYPFLATEFSAAGEEGEWRLRLTLGRDAPIGPMAAHVVVHTSHPTQKQVKIPVSGYVRPPLVVVPQAFDFGQRKLDESYPGAVEVKVLGPEPVSLGEVTSDLEGVEVEIQELEAGRRYQVVIRLGPGMRKGVAQGTLVVQTSSRRYPVLEIPVTGTVL